jgi:hypothetical protein
LLCAQGLRSPSVAVVMGVAVYDMRVAHSASIRRSNINI